MKDDSDSPEKEENSGQEPYKQPWQVIGCPTCRAPVGMRCTSSNMTTHSLRKRRFFDNLEAEKAEKAEKAEREAKSSGASGGTKKTSKFVKSAKAGGKTTWRSAKQKSAESENEAEVDSRADGGKALVDKPLQDWSGFAAQLRADNKINKASNPLNPIKDQKTTPVLPKVSVLPVSALKSAAQAPVLPPVKVKMVKAGPGVGAESAPTAPKPIAGVAGIAGSAVHGQPSLRIVANRENPAVWKTMGCPHCRAAPGARCAGQLGEVRFASHDARLESFRLSQPN